MGVTVLAYQFCTAQPSLQKECFSLHLLLILCMHQAVWWSYQQDEMSAVPDLTLQRAKSCIPPFQQLFFACACTSVLHAADNAKAS